MGRWLLRLAMRPAGQQVLIMPRRPGARLADIGNRKQQERRLEQ